LDTPIPASLIERAAAQRLAAHREPPSLVVVEPELAIVELPAEDPVLLEEQVEDPLLVPVHPAGEDQGQGVKYGTHEGPR
jgi:hypothetical protein